MTWLAAHIALGPTCDVWEADTFRIELTRRGIATSRLDALMAKLLGAQTIHGSNVWTHDHDALFAFALACDGLPAAADAHHHPTPEQLCWAFDEIARIRGRAPNDDVGVDCDAVDPAIAAVLHDEGFVVCPAPLGFAQDALDRFTVESKTLKSDVERAWRPLSSLSPLALRRMLEGEPEDAKGVQLRRLADCALYVADRAAQRARHDSTLRAHA